MKNSIPSFLAVNKYRFNEINYNEVEAEYKETIKRGWLSVDSNLPPDPRNVLITYVIGHDYIDGYNYEYGEAIGFYQDEWYINDLKREDETDDVIVVAWFPFPTRYHEIY